MARAYVGLGSNLGDRAATLRARVELLGERAGDRGRRRLDVPRDRSGRLSRPAAVPQRRRRARTTLARPGELLEALLEVERELGRTRDGPRYGPRTVDLDLLLVDGVVVDEPGLTIPHPRLHERAFALEPLAELDPDLVVPGRGPVADLLR